MLTDKMKNYEERHRIINKKSAFNNMEWDFDYSFPDLKEAVYKMRQKSFDAFSGIRLKPKVH